MSEGIPARKADELFNRLTAVQFEDVEIARRLALELRQLNRQKPGDFTTKTALAEALLLSGQRDEAVEQMVGAFHLRRRNAYAEVDRLAMLFSFIGDRQRAVQLIEEIAFQPGGFDVSTSDM